MLTLQAAGPSIPPYVELPPFSPDGGQQRIAAIRFHAGGLRAVGCGLMGAKPTAAVVPPCWALHDAVPGLHHSTASRGFLLRTPTAVGTPLGRAAAALLQDPLIQAARAQLLGGNPLVANWLLALIAFASGDAGLASDGSSLFFAMAPAEAGGLALLAAVLSHYVGEVRVVQLPRTSLSQLHNRQGRMSVSAGTIIKLEGEGRAFCSWSPGRGSRAGQLAMPSILPLRATFHSWLL